MEINLAIIDFNPGQGGGGVKPSGTLDIVENGVYNVYAYASASVDVHPSVSLSETYISNGNYNITGDFNGGVITVDVPAPQFVTETLNVSANGTYTPGQGVDGYSMVTVDVAGTDIQKDITEGIDYSYTTLNNNARFVASYRFYDRFINYKGSEIYLYSFTSINLPACSILYDYAFYNNNLSNISLPVCERIEGYAFQGCKLLSNISLPVCSYIGYAAFNECNNLSNISLPVCERIESYAFQYCYNLSNISLPVCSYIGEAAFGGCNNLSNISLPVCSYIGGAAFGDCYNLSNISLPVCSYIGEFAFQGCNNLSNISLPVCERIESNAFNRCSNLSNISLPVCSYIGEAAFQGCELLSNISLPVCSYIGFAAFGGCNNLSNISLPVCSYIGGGAFNECYSLSKLTLLYSSVVTIEDNLGWDWGITPDTGSIFVPASLVDAYKSANYWSEYSNRIFPIE